MAEEKKDPNEENVSDRHDEKEGEATSILETAESIDKGKDTETPKAGKDQDRASMESRSETFSDSQNEKSEEAKQTKDETCSLDEPQSVIRVDDERPMKAEELNPLVGGGEKNKTKDSTEQPSPGTLTLIDNVPEETEEDDGTIVRNTSSVLVIQSLTTADEEAQDNKEEITVEKKTSEILFGKVYTDSDILLEDEKLEPESLVVGSEASIVSPDMEKAAVGFYVQSSEDETEREADLAEGSPKKTEDEETGESSKISKVSKGDEGKLKRNKRRDAIKKHLAKQVTDAYEDENNYEESGNVQTDSIKSERKEEISKNTDKREGNSAQTENKVTEQKRERHRDSSTAKKKRKSEDKPW